MGAEVWQLLQAHVRDQPKSGSWEVELEVGVRTFDGIYDTYEVDVDMRHLPCAIASNSRLCIIYCKERGTTNVHAVFLVRKPTGSDPRIPTLQASTPSPPTSYEMNETHAKTKSILALASSFVIIPWALSNASWTD